MSIATQGLGTLVVAVALIGMQGACTSRHPPAPSEASIADAKPTLTQLSPTTKPSGPRLSAVEALRIADQRAKEAIGRFEAFDSKQYPGRSAEYDPASSRWFVFYFRQPNRYPGDHFTVYVDDETGKTWIVGGA